MGNVKKREEKRFNAKEMKEYGEKWRKWGAGKKSVMGLKKKLLGGGGKIKIK